MSRSTITIIINNNAYTLSSTDLASLQSIPDADRMQLMALLEAIKRQETASRSDAQQAVASAKANMVNPAGITPARSERLGSGDVDNIMAQLIMEERLNQKPELTRDTIYKWVAVVGIVIVLLLALF